MEREEGTEWVREDSHGEGCSQGACARPSLSEALLELKIPAQQSSQSPSSLPWGPGWGGGVSQISLDSIFVKRRWEDMFHFFEHHS